MKRFLLRMAPALACLAPALVFSTGEVRAQAGPMLAMKKFPFDIQWIAVSLNNKPFPGERADRPSHRPPRGSGADGLPHPFPALPPRRARSRRPPRNVLVGVARRSREGALSWLTRTSRLRLK
mgnify:CR=1 FL=1